MGWEADGDPLSVGVLGCSAELREVQPERGVYSGGGWVPGTLRDGGSGCGLQQSATRRNGPRNP